MRSKIIKKKQEAINLVNEQNKLHKGKWLTWEDANNYRKRACDLQVLTGEMTGKKYELMLELVEEYGVTQLEATNILNGYHVADYVNKYYRIKNLIPLDIKEKKSEKDDENAT